MNASSFQLSNKQFFLWGIIFACIQAVFIAFEWYAIALLPFAIFGIWLAIYRIEWIWFFTVFATPLSINLESLDIAPIGMYLPTEPIIAGLLILMFYKILSRQSIDVAIFKHPFSKLLGLYLLWMVFTAITSEFPIVSFKFIATRLWFISGFYLIGTHLFSDTNNIKKFFGFYLIPLVGVVVYTVSRHAQFLFDKESAHWVMEPLFKDHTSYGAVLAMFFPVVVGQLFLTKKNALITFIYYLAFVIITIGLVLSYTRAAWISVFAAALLFGILSLRIPFKTMLITSIGASVILLFSWSSIQQQLGRNKQESSDKLDEHVSSISNVSSDASNLERLNRWNCAINLFQERPITGWGPGTYQFVYAPFQRAKDRTIISTNNGDGGNAHSEYLGPLAEQGILGSVLFVSILLFMLHMGFKLYYRANNRDNKIIIAMVFLGLFTYFVHGTLNNYLDTDKASVPFWAFFAVLVAMDLYHEKENAIISNEVRE
jgi:putative inorganic carbon (hco3(-)) transporter